MKVYDVYTVALSFVSEKPKQDDLQSFVLQWMNLLLSESFTYENALRRFKGLEELTEIPVLNSLQDEIPYQYEIIDPALIYGLTSFIAQDDDNEYRTQRYRAMYVQALYDTQHYEKEIIEDVYCAEDDE